MLWVDESARRLTCSTTSFLYDGANIGQEQSGGSASVNILTGEVDALFSRTDASGTVTPVQDSFGSMVALTDANGVIQTTYSCEPFGKSATSGTANGNSQKYTGREDDATGLLCPSAFTANGGSRCLHYRLNALVIVVSLARPSPPTRRR